MLHSQFPAPLGLAIQTKVKAKTQKNFFKELSMKMLFL